MNPFVRVANLDDETLDRLMRLAQRLMQRNLDGQPRRTRFGGRHSVYNRGCKPCPSCGTEIRMQRQGTAGRSTYWCPQRQRADGN